MWAVMSQWKLSIYINGDLKCVHCVFPSRGSTGRERNDTPLTLGPSRSGPPSVGGPGKEAAEEPLQEEVHKDTHIPDTPKLQSSTASRSKLERSQSRESGEPLICTHTNLIHSFAKTKYLFPYSFRKITHPYIDPNFYVGCLMHEHYLWWHISCVAVKLEAVPGPTTDKPALSEEEMERRSKSIIDEFLHINDYKVIPSCNVL